MQAYICKYLYAYICIRILFCVSVHVYKFMHKFYYFILEKKVIFLQTWISSLPQDGVTTSESEWNLHSQHSLFRHFWAPPSSVSELGWTGAMPAIWPPLWGLCVTSWCCQIPFLQTDVHLPLTFTAGVGHQPQRTGQSLSWHEDWDVLWAREGYPDGFLHWGAG